MRIQDVAVRSSAALVFFTSMTLFVSSAHAQGSSPTGAESVGPQVEDGVVRELLRKIQEQQKSLDEQQKILSGAHRGTAATAWPGHGNECGDRRQANFTVDNGKCLGANERMPR